MAIFKCDSCGYEREVPVKLAGKKAKCPDCGHGVVILDHLLEEDVPYDVDYEEDDSSASTDIPESFGSDGTPIESIDLDDNTVTVELDKPDDVICAKCGHVQDAGHEGRCAKCGASIAPVADILEIDADEVDVSDLADAEEAQVWDAKVDDGDADSEGIEAVYDPDRWRLFRGSFSLNLYAGIVSGVLALFFVYSLSLLASANAGTYDFLPYALGTAVVGVIVGSIFNAFFSRIPFGLVGPETVLTAILFLYIGSIYRAMELESAEFIIPTLLAGVALAAVLIGLSLLVLSKFRLGEYIRYIPLQIIGGVIGAVGIVVLLAAFDWTGRLGIDWSNSYSVVTSLVNGFDTGGVLRTLGPSLVFGIALFLALCRTKHSLFLVAMILVASGAGYGAGIWGGTDALRLMAAPIEFPEGPMLVYPFQVLNSEFFFQNIQWAVIKDNGLYVGAMVVLSILTVMYRITRLEIIRGRESDLNVEYRALGLTNIISGLCGGMPASLTYGRSSGSYASGGRGPVAGIVAGLVCATGLCFADVILPLIPRFVPEGLLVYAGLDLIRDWMFRTKTAFTGRSDIWLLWLTFIATLFLGILEGIGFGVALALMVTVSRASKDGVVRNILSGANHSSSVDRASVQKRILKEYGDHIHIMRLQGFLFLGAMERLLKDIRTRIDDRNQLPVEYLILDFKLVTGFASAAGIGFDKLHNLVAAYDMVLIITNAPLELEEHLEAIGLVGDQEGVFKSFLNLDYALEWCENRVLDAENLLELKQSTLPELLAPVFPEPKLIPALMKVLKREVAKPGEAVFRQGDVSDSMFFVESGRLDVELEMEGGKILRLKKVGPGAVFGEMGIYTLAPRSATIRAAESCVLYRMTLAKLDAIEHRAPRLVTAINRLLINMLSERLIDANARVRDLMR
ncbi:SulP family inorganic anion transporter [uncultured Pseudodesulfovibrio sp.]|uniref:SulP family inorganic anion transporter n=1 Tax=uncultured Pseudodesulfovibrio sp. TaxID=2035858 RepID=UPI0029C69EFC|nr:SulP family inorganic anion transporter [uncultured Pseudodesulfovibrio sp.]